MPRHRPNGTVWGRAEAVDSLGWRPGRTRRILLAGLGTASLALGAYIGTTASGEGTPSGAAGPRSTPPPQVAVPTAATCSSVGVTLRPEAYPAEGVPEASVVRLYRADPDGTAVMIVPQAHLLRSVARQDGTLSMSVLIRSGEPGGDAEALAVTGASAAGALTATVLYDVDPIEVLDACREV